MTVKCGVRQRFAFCAHGGGSSFYLCCHPERSEGPVHFRRVETKTGPVVHSIVFFAIDWVQETKGSLSAYARRFFARRGGPPREVEVVEVESQWTARDRETQARGGRDRVFLYQVSVQKNKREPGAPALP